MAAPRARVRWLVLLLVVTAVGGIFPWRREAPAAPAAPMAAPAAAPPLTPTPPVGERARKGRPSSFGHLGDADLITRIEKLEGAMTGGPRGNASAWAPRRLRLLADLKDELARRDGRGPPARRPRGVLVWSLGRCATGTFTDSVRKSAGASYCNNRKEGFGFVGLSPGELTRCLDRAARKRGAALTHVKPQHLIVKLSKLRTPDALMAAVAATGAWAGVVVIRRANHLARLVSSFENRVAEWGFAKDDASRNDSKVERRALTFFADPVRTMEWEAATLERGATAAARLGLDVLEFDFVDLVSDVCDAVQRVLTRFLPGHASTCVEQHSHRGASRRDAGLAGRIGPAAAALVEAKLARTPYAWMLDLAATAWPPDVARPTPVAHPNGPR